MSLYSPTYILICLKSYNSSKEVNKIQDFIKVMVTPSKLCFHYFYKEKLLTPVCFLGQYGPSERVSSLKIISAEVTVLSEFNANYKMDVK